MGKSVLPKRKKFLATDPVSKLFIKRTFLFLTGQTVTLFGSSLVQYAISWHILLTTKSGLMMSIATLCGFLPQVLISLFSGVWADRYNRKRLIIIADSMIAICTAVLAVLFTIGYTEIWLLFVVSAIRSLGAGVQAPAVGALLPELVPQEKLMRVNGINASIQSIMMLISPAVAGGLYSITGLGPIFWVDIVTAAIGISLLLVLKVLPREVTEHKEEHFFRELYNGFHYVAKTKWLRQFFSYYLITSLMFAPSVFLSPLMIARSFGDEPWRLVAHETVFFIGSIVGGLFVSTLGSKLRNKMHMIIISLVNFGVTTLILGFSPNFWFYLGVMLLMGVTNPLLNTSATTVLQTKIQPELMGRVFGLYSIIGFGAMPLTMVFYGPLADVMSIQNQLIITGALMIVISIFALRFKEMREAGVLLPSESALR